MKNIYLFSLLLFSISVSAQPRWSAKKANQWYKKQAWSVGCNFIPSTAINQLEMWQAESFDPQTIDRELGWAENIGFNIVRVYLHSLAWQSDKIGFKKRIDDFLKIANSHKIKVLFVFFDDCWNDNPTLGKQPEPKIGVHNSGWVQCPAKANVLDSLAWEKLELEGFVKDILKSFGKDKRVILWDLYNEPGNSDLKEKAYLYSKKYFSGQEKQIPPSQFLLVFGLTTSF